MPLSSILEKILADARREAEAIETAGRAEAAALGAAAAKEAAALRRRLVAEARERMRARREREISSRRLKHARDRLAVRRACLDAVFAELPKRLIPDSADEYAALLVALAGEDVVPGRAVLEVGRRDWERFGETFAAAVLREFTAAFAGRDAVLSGAPATFSHGLVVRQPGFVRNCSLEDLVAEGREEMEGEVAKTLFATG